MTYKGLLIRPMTTPAAVRLWCVRLRHPETGEMKPVTGVTVEEAANKVIDLGMFEYAEKFEAPRHQR
jgi:hypothetical protein